MKTVKDAVTAARLLHSSEISELMEALAPRPNRRFHAPSAEDLDRKNVGSVIAVAGRDKALSRESA